ncbi:MAG: Arm DNA-binding domain-containing protein, partial [Bacteroidota bacterium]
MQATTAIILDTRRKKKDGTFPVKLRVTHNRKQKFYGTKISLTKSDFEKATGSRPRKEFKELQIQMQAIEQKAPLVQVPT